MPFLRQIQFDDYAKRLSAISEETGFSKNSLHNNEGNAADVKPASPQKLLTRYVGFNEKLIELHTVLASAGVNSMWIRGEPGTGKTAIAEEFLRARAQNRLSSAMLGRPFFVFNVSPFLSRPPPSWVEDYNKCLEYIRKSHGFLIIDQIDDLVKASGESSDRIMQSLIACLKVAMTFKRSLSLIQKTTTPSLTLQRDSCVAFRLWRSKNGVSTRSSPFSCRIFVGSARSTTSIIARPRLMR